MTRVALLSALVLAAACRDDESAGGRITVAWTGGDTGRLVVPATARWCAGDSLMEIIGAAGDSAVAIGILPVDTLSPRTFPVGIPQASRPRPTARVGVRWYGETLIEGYYGLSGTVTVDSGAGLNGSLEATLRSVNDGSDITLSGTFQRITIQPGSAQSCGAAVISADSAVR